MGDARTCIDSYGGALPVSKDRLIASLIPRVGFTSYPWVSRAMPLGASRFGGPVDLPTGVDWPSAEGRPLLLLAQLNFNNLPITRSHPTLEQLPRRGWFCLFLDVDWDGNLRGSDAANPGVVAMQFDVPAESLVRHDPAPASDAETWTQCHAVTVYPADHHLCLPSVDAVESPLAESDRSAFRNAYEELESKVENLARTRHDVTLLGTPALFNPDPRLSREAPTEWMLLLQFSGECSWLAGVADLESGYPSQPKFGSADFVQYFVRKSDYAAGRLDRGFLEYMLT